MRIRLIAPVLLSLTLGSLICAAQTAQLSSPTLQRADAAFRAGQMALSRQDLATAQREFEDVVRLVPAMEQGHSALGAVLLNRGHPVEAIHELEVALAIRKGDTTAQTNLALAYQETGDSAKAIPLFASLQATALSTHHPLAPEIAAEYARALAAMGQLDEATKTMKTAVTGSPKNSALHDALGSLYAQQKNWADAQAEFKKAIGLDASKPMPHFHLGLTLEAEQMDGSSELQRAAELAPDNPLIATEAGKAFASAGRAQEALEEFQQVLRRDPDSTAAMFQEALVLQQMDRSAEALPLLKRVVEKESNNADALVDLGMALAQAQQAAGAVPLLQRSILLNPQNPIAYEDLAAAYIQLNQIDDAITQLRAALKLAPESPQIHYDLGLALKFRDDPAAAIPEFEAAERLDTNAPEPPYALGQLYLQAGRYPDAARELQRSLELRPANGDGWATLGSVYNSLDKLPEAVGALQEAVKQLPGHPEPHLTLASVLIKENKPDEATQERKIAAELMRANMNLQRAEVATNAGNSMFRHGDLNGAEGRYREALSYDSKYREAHVGLARVLEAEGKALEAAAERKQADAQPTGAPTP